MVTEDTNNSVDQETSSLLDNVLDNVVKSSNVNSGNSGSDGATGVIVVTLLGAIAVVVGVGYVAYKKNKRMAMEPDRTALVEDKMSSSVPDMQSYGAATTV